VFQKTRNNINAKDLTKYIEVVLRIFDTSKEQKNYEREIKTKNLKKSYGNKI
jgi:hypothetical protein